MKVTLGGSIVLITSFPSGVKVMASMSSALAVSPTSEPSKYHSKVPAVVLPIEVGWKRRMSESSTRTLLPKPFSVGKVVSAVKLSRILPSAMM